MDIQINDSNVSTHVTTTEIRESVKCHSPLIPGTNKTSNYLSCRIIDAEGNKKYIIINKQKLKEI